MTYYVSSGTLNPTHLHSRLNCSGSTAGSRTESQTLGPAKKMHESQRRRYGKLAELTIDDIWQIADAGDQQLQRLACTK